MNDNREPNYYRIGSFVILGLVLIIMAIVFLGSGKFFNKTLYAETYFNESVQGLTIGSPVKYRGMEIGRVDRIAYANAIYPNHKCLNPKTFSRYIYVRLAITSNFLSHAPLKEEAKLLDQEIKDGLRIKLSPAGLTGSSYIELNFVNPKTNPPLKIDWKPKSYYIPSATSTLTQFSDNVQYLLGELRKVDLDKLFLEIEQVTEKSNHLVTKANRILSKNAAPLRKTIDNFKKASENLNELSEKLKAYPSQLVFGNPPPKLDPKKL